MKKARRETRSENRKGKPKTRPQEPRTGHPLELQRLWLHRPFEARVN